MALDGVSISRAPISAYGLLGPDGLPEMVTTCVRRCQELVA